MEFSINESIKVLSNTPAILEAVLHDVSDEWIMNNEGIDTWSPFDVIGHLIHGEKTDWIPRMEIILSNAQNKTFNPFDRFAQFEESKDKNIKALLTEFQQLRENNIRILRAINITDEMLDKKGLHPSLGEVTLKQLLSTWVVHDLAHIGQIVRVMSKQLKTEVGPWKEYLGILKS